MKPVLRFIKVVLVKNWWLKLAAIVLAYALWIMVRGGEGERVITVPLTVQIPRDMAIVNERPTAVECTAVGFQPNLAGQTPSLSYDIDLRSAKEGEQTVALSPAGVRISAASDLRIIRVNPARITLVLQKIISKQVAVKVPIRGEPAAGFDLYKLTWMPNVVLVSGPRSDIDALREMLTGPVSVAGRDRSFQTAADLDVQNDNVHTSPVGPIAVDIRLGPHREARRLSVPVAVSDDDNFSVSPTVVSVRLLVPVTFKGRITAEDLKATVTIPNPPPASNRFTVRPAIDFARDLDAGIAIDQVNPEEVTLNRKARKQ